MVIRLSKRLFFKPRICPMCGKRCYFCDWWTAIHCKKCAIIHRHHKKNQKKHEKRKILKRLGIYKYGEGWKSFRKQKIKQHPYCSLCGVSENLTVHHVGGGCEHYTVLCDECHQAYEKFNLKRKEKNAIHGVLQRLKLWRSEL